MEKYHFLAVYFLLCTGYIPLSTNAFILSSDICGTNQNANTLIHGDNQNAIINFAQVISNKGKFDLYGDSENHTGGCRNSADKYKHRKGRLYGGHTWTLDCWEPVECTMIETVEHGRDTVKLIPFSSSPYGKVNVKTVLLPIDELNTVSYTFLPASTQKGIFFVTALLTGCSVFVAKPDNLNCNLIVMHTNYFCTSSSTTDFNHEQAMAVLELVRDTNKQCTYNEHSIRRWAADVNRNNILAAHHSYANNIYFYRMSYVNFFDGFHAGGHNGNWRFCSKELHNDAPLEHCHVI